MPLLPTFLVLLLVAAGPLWGQAQPAAAPAPPQGGAGDLLVTPTRMVFEGRKRVLELNLSNAGDARATYRLSLVRMEMDDLGGMAEKPMDAGSEALVSLFRFSPREVSLDPGETQTLRIQVRKPEHLADGEYRLHLLIRAVPPAPPAGPLRTEAPKGLAIRLTPVYGLAIPLIVRQGASTAKVSLVEPRLAEGGRILEVRLARSGNQSVYGDLRAEWLKPGGPAAPLGEVTGLAVYTPNSGRMVRLSLSPPPPGGARLRVRYAAPPAEGGGTLAETTFQVP